MAMEEPRPGVVRLEADRDVVARGGRARAHDVAEDRVVVVVRGAARAADDREGVLEGMDVSTSARRERREGNVHRAGGRDAARLEPRRSRAA